MADPLKKYGGILAACFLLLTCTAWISSRFNNSAAFERPIHFSILTLFESGLVIAVGCRKLSPRKDPTSSQEYQLAIPSSLKHDWKQHLQAAIDAVQNCCFLSSPSFILGGLVVLRSLLFWRTIRTIHCSWESFETFVPALVALFTTASPTAIQLQQHPGLENRPRRCFNVGSVRYVVVAVIWACSARTTLALSAQSAGAICPAGFLRWERQIPLAQVLAVILDAVLLICLSRWRQDAVDDAPQAWAFASRLFLRSAGVLAVLATFSFYNLRNIRWAFDLHYVGVRDLLVDSTVASAALTSAFYVASDIHPGTLAVIVTAFGVYAHHLMRMLQTSSPVDDSLVYMISGGLTIAGVGLLLRYEKDITSTSSAISGDPRLMRFLTGWYVIFVGFLCATYLILYPDVASSDTLSFPDLLSAANAESDAWIARANQSRTLEGAVSEYRRRYGLAPPPNFDKWFEYAVTNGSPVIDDFTQINDDLLPFWGVAPDVLRQRTRHVIEVPWLGMGGIRIRGGKVEVSPGTPGSHMWMMRSMQDMIEEFAEHLPDMDFAINLNDEPRVSISFEDMQQLQTTAVKSQTRLLNNNNLKTFDSSKPPVWSDDDVLKSPHERSPYFTDRVRDQIYYDFIAQSCPPESPARKTRWWSRREACRDCVLPHAVRLFEGLENPVVSNWTAATDLCHQPDLAYLHGFLASPAPAIFTKAPFPVFSQSRTSGFADILVPSPWNYDDKAAYDEGEDVEWERKKNTMFWRGSSSDGYAARGSWQGFLRARFVWAANAIQTKSAPAARLDAGGPPGPATPGDGKPDFDVGFVGGFSKCHTDDCQSQRDTFWGGDSSSKSKVAFGEHWQYAHLMDLDGAGFSGRFIPFLRSRSLVYRAGLFRTWFGERVHAWRHYVPVDARLHELGGLVRYFGARDDEEGGRRAREIAEEGRAWAARALRREDMRVYMFRLLLEWGRVVDDAREGLGFTVVA
ncbi:Putative glycosyl transferase CAP10 domain-containing protein [Colletotrichum destructivum]|uniref:Glycosyl transferase CAP10 domain-containing protein n=1 Tax=Colletotrichum destructivum TaxID=34406 RepID=A0AAX4ILS8_9PEZI|nr:Putative glycosyl transferase CAP10 domain-containing protein [Colletotrichum destructivum]